MQLQYITRLYEKDSAVFAATYDAFGNRSITTGDTTFARGYCGVHQHYPLFDIIDMGGRMYDPIVGRFLSPDPYIQEWDNSQNFNRYSYCLNNPLKYTDPSGEFIWWPVIALSSTFAVGNLTSHWIAGDINNFGNGAKMFAQGAIVGAALGAAVQIPGISNVVSTTWRGLKIANLIYGVTTIGSGTANLIARGNLNVFTNAFNIWLGQFSLDNNSFFWRNSSRSKSLFLGIITNRDWKILRIFYESCLADRQS